MHLNMNVLIIGCNGFIGSHAFRYFTEKKYHVTGCDIQKVNAATFLLEPDLSNLPLLFKSQQFNICINASGSATVGFSIQNEEKDYILNFKNVQLILDCIKNEQANCKFINLSSAAVYGNPQTLPVSEEAATMPISPYGKHKLMSEQLINQYVAQYQLQAISLRIFSVYGVGLKKQLFWDIYQKSKRNNCIELYGNGNETRDFIHVDDLLRAIEIIIHKADFNGKSINVAAGVGLTIKEAAITLLNNLDPGFELQFSGVQNPADPRFWQADITQLKKMGFNPLVKLADGLNKYALWLKELN